MKIKAKFRKYTVLLIGIVISFSACEGFEKQHIILKEVHRDTSWKYRQFDPIIGERSCYVLIDGELDEEAGLEVLELVHGIKSSKEGHKVIRRNYIRLPKGRFSLYDMHDFSTTEKYIYHPQSAKKGQIDIKIQAGFYERDTVNQSNKRRQAKSDMTRSGMFEETNIDL
nr:hypothetical protein [uncultured Arsenicibacter sp.]